MNNILAQMNGKPLKIISIRSRFAGIAVELFHRR